MRKSIFDIEFRFNELAEFKRLKDALLKENTILYNRDYYSLYELFDEFGFPYWKYKDTFIEMSDYLFHIGVDIRKNYVDKESFVNFIEFLLNISKVTLDSIEPNKIKFVDNKINGVISHNCPLLLEKMNYKALNEDDRIIVVKRDADVDSILNLVDNNLSQLLLSYNDIRNNNISSKINILKNIDREIEVKKKKLKSFDTDTYNSIQTIVNKMGVNHPIDEEPYVGLNEEELIEWYDRCFVLMIHLLRSEFINDYNKLRKEISDK